jgi:hypothetical protein
MGLIYDICNIFCIASLYRRQLISCNGRILYKKLFISFMSVTCIHMSTSLSDYKVYFSLHHNEEVASTLKSIAKYNKLWSWTATFQLLFQWQQLSATDLQVSDDAMLIQLSQFWTLSTVLDLRHDVSETGFCLCLQVEATQMGSASLCLVGIMDTVQNWDSYTVCPIRLSFLNVFKFTVCILSETVISSCPSSFVKCKGGIKGTIICGDWELHMFTRIS